MSTTTDDPGVPDAPPLGRWATFRAAVRRSTEPAASGLPRWPIQLWFPAVLVVVLIAATALGVSGSSTGMLWAVVGSGPDPDLLSGTPRATRSDEWLTQMAWIVSQASQGYPEINQVVPGGMDATVLLGLPAWDWPTIFRPDAAGFLFLGLDRGLAIRWWLPGFAMMAACYAMLISLLPRRPLSCAAIAVSVFFWPMIQWWYLPSITWPVALCFLAIAAAVFALRDPRLWVRILWATATGYVAVAAAFTFYPPYLIPAVLVAAAIIVGLLVAEIVPGTAGGLGLRAGLQRMVPLVLAALAAGGVLLAFFVTRGETIAAINNTVYPGQRLQPPGAATWVDVVATFGGLFAGGMDFTQTYSGLLGPNASEASAPILLGVYLLIPLAYFVVRDWVIARRVQWVMLACLGCAALLLAYLVVPGWDPIAHLLLLDRTTVTRSRIGLGLLGVVAIGLLVRRLDEHRTDGPLPTEHRTGRHRSAGPTDRMPWWVSGLTVAAAVAGILLVHSALTDNQDQALGGANHLRLVAALFVIAVLLYTRGLAGPASAALLAISVVLTIGVNPLYRGVLDLTETTVGQRVESVNQAQPGTWLAISSVELSSVLVEAGIPAYNGVQLYPAREMWQDVDPDGEFADEWNRYASMVWEPGSGEPVLRNPQADVVIATFDSCSTFAQQHVSYVLADREVDQPCLETVDAGKQGPTPYWIYRVVA